MRISGIRALFDGRDSIVLATASGYTVCRRADAFVPKESQNNSLVYTSCTMGDTGVVSRAMKGRKENKKERKISTNFP